MPRKGPAIKRQLVTDPVYGSPLVTALVNKVLREGKRSLAERIVYGALEGCKDKTGNDPVVTLKRALDNVKPRWRSRAAVSVARPTRSPSRSRPPAAPPWRCAGSWPTHASAARRR